MTSTLLHPAGTRLRIHWVPQPELEQWIPRTDVVVVERSHPSGLLVRWDDDFMTVTIRPAQIIDVQVVES